MHLNKVSEDTAAALQLISVAAKLMHQGTWAYKNAVSVGSLLP